MFSAADVIEEKPLAEFPDSKKKVRPALNRATRKAARSVATATDEQFLYI